MISDDLITDTTGVILAGGQSRRMGRDKATLDWQGRTLFEGVLAALQACLPQVVIAGDRPDLARPNVPCFADRYPGSALGGICTALERVPTSWIFVAPCDLPHPDAALIRRILAARPGAEVVLPRTPRGLEPVFAAYHKNCIAPMRRLLAAGNPRIFDFFPEVTVHYLDPPQLPPDWETALTNLNTPADLDRLLAVASKKE